MHTRHLVTEVEPEGRGLGRGEGERAGRRETRKHIPQSKVTYERNPKAEARTVVPMVGMRGRILGVLLALEKYRRKRSLYLQGVYGHDLHLVIFQFLGLRILLCSRERLETVSLRTPSFWDWGAQGIKGPRETGITSVQRQANRFSMERTFQQQ